MTNDIVQKAMVTNDDECCRVIDFELGGSPVLYSIIIIGFLSCVGYFPKRDCFCVVLVNRTSAFTEEVGMFLLMRSHRHAYPHISMHL